MLWNTLYGTGINPPPFKSVRTEYEHFAVTFFNNGDTVRPPPRIDRITVVGDQHSAVDSLYIDHSTVSALYHRYTHIDMHLDGAMSVFKKSQ